jgi:hypothetical protein
LRNAIESSGVSSSAHFNKMSRASSGLIKVLPPSVVLGKTSKARTTSLCVQWENRAILMRRSGMNLRPPNRDLGHQAIHFLKSLFEGWCFVGAGFFFGFFAWPGD